MAFGKIEGIEIKGIICALSDNKIKTMEHAEVFDSETLKRVIEQTGVKQTYRTKEKQTISDLCFVAADKLLQSLDWERGSIGAIVLATHAFDYGRPSSTSVLQKRLQLSKDCMTLDINLGCSGFIYGMAVLGSLMSTMDIDRAILMCGDMSSKAVRPDNTTNLLFGDIGAAIALEKEDAEKAMHFLLNADGNRYKSIFMQGGGFRHPDSRNVYVEMDGVDVFAFSALEVPRSIFEFLSKANMGKDDFDMYALHQANVSVLNRIIKKCGFEKEKTPIILDQYGNTNSSSIPLTIADAICGMTKREDMHILASGFGIGLSWGVGDMFVPKEAKIEIVLTNYYYDDETDEMKECK